MSCIDWMVVIVQKGGGRSADGETRCEMRGEAVSSAEGGKYGRMICFFA